MLNAITREFQTYESLSSLMEEKGFSVWDLANKNYFKNNMPYPPKSEFKDIVKTCECCGAVTKVITPGIELWKKARDDYHNEEGRLYSIFKQLLYKEHNVKGAKADKAFELAWDKGHAYGYSEVASYFSDFVELIKD
jgi:hypothetical protein